MLKMVWCTVYKLLIDIDNFWVGQHIFKILEFDKFLQVFFHNTFSFHLSWYINKVLTKIFLYFEVKQFLKLLNFFMTFTIYISFIFSYLLFFFVFVVTLSKHPSSELNPGVAQSDGKKLTMLEYDSTVKCWNERLCYNIKWESYTRLQKWSSRHESFMLQLEYIDETATVWGINVGFKIILPVT